MKWTEDPVKIDAYLNEIEEQMCPDCKGQDNGYASYCDDCATLADFRTALKTCRAQSGRIRMLREELGKVSHTQEEE